MSHKPRDLFPATLKVAQAFFREYDQVEDGKQEAKKALCEKYDVPRDEAFRWIYVVRPHFQKQGERWPFYQDIDSRGLNPSEYSDEAKVDPGGQSSLESEGSSESRFVESPPYRGPSDLDENAYLRALYEIDPSIQGLVSSKVHAADPIEATFGAVGLEDLREEHNQSLDAGRGGIHPHNAIGHVRSHVEGESYSGPADQPDDPVEEGPLGGSEEEEDPYKLWQEQIGDIDQGEDPDPGELTDRERYIAAKLQKGHTIEGLVDDLGTRRSVLKRHLKDLKRQGWSIYFDSSSETVAIEGDNVLRSSEHKGTRTRKANRWWQLRNNELIRKYRGIEVPDAGLTRTDTQEDWVTHLTDLHAGDKVRQEDGTVIYETEDIPDVIDYITEQSLSLARRHNASYDDAHILWGGDMVTNEGIYEGQFEDLDAWLDEQVDTLITPLVRQIKTFAQSDQFNNVQVVAVVGNHGEHRASATSRQANADLILYKFIRNAIAELNEHAGILDNVRFRIGQGQSVAYRNFDMRGGKIRGHLRHGQNRKPQAETSARKKAWQSTYIDHDFDIGYLGHHHVSGRIPWNGPPIIASGSPKPAGEFVERIGERGPESDYQNVATVHGVSDDGLTCVYPVDTRNYA